MDREREREPGARLVAVGTGTVDADAAVRLDEGSTNGEAKPTRPATGAALERRNSRSTSPASSPGLRR